MTSWSLPRAASLITGKKFFPHGLDSINRKNTMVLGGGLNVISRLGVDWWPKK